MGDPKLERARGISGRLGFYLLWILLAAFGALVALQLHATIIFFSLKIVENPATRPAGWNTDTIYGLSRFLFLVLGALWLVGALFLESYLSGAAEQHRLVRRSLWLALSLASIYAATYLVQLLAA
ncbi:MAG: hypothetical protein JSW55_11190 [Chloroflexota bacterium]|nr:MAG: hypothetical protein JSW55_11190 [Chloroflexota bacterium]